MMAVSDKVSIVASADLPGGGADGVVPQGLLLHKFVKVDSWRGALTADATGANLPQLGSAWIYAKEVLVSHDDRRTGATSPQIARGMLDRGYFLFPIGDDV